MNGSSSDCPVCARSCSKGSDGLSSRCSHVVVLAGKVCTGSSKWCCDTVVDLGSDSVRIILGAEWSWVCQGQMSVDSSCAEERCETEGIGELHIDSVDVRFLILFVCVFCLLIRPAE